MRIPTKHSIQISNPLTNRITAIRVGLRPRALAEQQRDSPIAGSRLMSTARQHEHASPRMDQATRRHDARPVLRNAWGSTQTGRHVRRIRSTGTQAATWEPPFNATAIALSRDNLPGKMREWKLGCTAHRLMDSLQSVSSLATCTSRASSVDLEVKKSRTYSFGVD